MFCAQIAIVIRNRCPCMPWRALFLRMFMGAMPAAMIMQVGAYMMAMASTMRRGRVAVRARSH
jgi:hypothetical protein